VRAYTQLVFTRLRAQRAFTLIEMLVVIAIISILLVVSASFFTALFSSLIRSQETFSAQALQQTEFGYLNARLAQATQVGLTCGAGESQNTGGTCSGGNTTNIDNLTIAGDQVVFKTTTACYRVFYVEQTETLWVASTSYDFLDNNHTVSCASIAPTRGPNDTTSTTNDPIFGTANPAALTSGTGGSGATSYSVFPLAIDVLPNNGTSSTSTTYPSFSTSFSGNTTGGSTLNYPFSYLNSSNTSQGIDQQALDTGNHASWYSSGINTTTQIAALRVTSYLTAANGVSTATTTNNNLNYAPPVSTLQQVISVTQTGTGGTGSAMGSGGTATTTTNSDVSCTGSGSCTNSSIHPQGDNDPPASGCTGICAGIDNGTSLPTCSLANDGKIIYYQNSAMASQGVTWQFRCSATNSDGSTSSSANKWSFVGGSSLFIADASVNKTSGAAYAPLSLGNGLVVPLAGTYNYSITVTPVTNASTSVQVTSIFAYDFTNNVTYQSVPYGGLQLAGVISGQATYAPITVLDHANMPQGITIQPAAELATASINMTYYNISMQLTPVATH
jgi:prepilin-type N-terminal cleavage/methylation domain-containing protein